MNLTLFHQGRNVKEYVGTVTSLERRDAGVPGLCLAHGQRGMGKSRAALWHASRNGSIFLRAKTRWSDLWMLEEMALELGITPKANMRYLLESVVSALKENPRLIIIDEINIPPLSCLGTIRDVHDLSENPFCLIGHEGVIQRLKRIGPLFDRLLYVTEFKPFSFDDMKGFAAETLDVPATDETITKIVKHTQGNLRKAIVHLKGAESRARNARSQEITPNYLKMD